MNKKLTKKDLAKKSIFFEQKILKENVGSQDQITTAIGGTNYIRFKKNKSMLNDCGEYEKNIWSFDRIIII